MGHDNLASGVDTKRMPPKITPIVGDRTAVIGLVGTAKMGPMGLENGQPVELTSWQDFVDLFGGHDADATLPIQAYMAWQNDKSALIKCVRTTHYTTPSDATTKTSVAATIDIDSVATAATAGAVTGTVAGHTYDDAGTLTRAWRLANGDTLDIHCDEDVGGPDTATITATAASLTGGATGLPVNMGDTITFQCDKVPGTQTITYSAAHATIELVAQDINDQVAGFKAIVVGAATVDFTSDTLGSNSQIDITAETGTGASDIGHTAPSVGAGAGGNVGDVFNVTWQELKTIIEAAVVNPVTGVTVSLNSSNFLVITSNTTGAASSIQVEVASTADDEIGLDNVLHMGSAVSSVPTLTVDGKWDGTYAHDLRIVISDAINGEAAYFNLTVTDDSGIVLETFTNLQIATLTDPDYVETVINADPSQGGSRYISVTDLLTAIRPVNGTSTPAGGNDGLVGLTDTDFIGDAAGENGVHGFDQDDEVTIIADGGIATSAWQNGLLSYCETEKDGLVFAIIDPPASQSYSQIKTYKITTAALSSDVGALYWPRIKILNPDENVYTSDSEGRITIAPSGAMAGVYSRNDSHRDGGVHTEPAGFDKQANNGIIYGAVALETDSVKDIAVRKVVFPEGINPISQEKGTPIFADGEYTLDRSSTRSAWDTVGQQRGMIFLDKSIKDGIAFARHKSINQSLFTRVTRTIRAFLRAQMALGAFASNIEEDAFQLQCDARNNTAATQDLYRLIVDYSVAKVKPAIFVTVRVSQYLGSAE
jgi:uncharacterized protein